MDYSILLVKSSQRRLNPKIIGKNIEGILRRSLAGNRSTQGWICERWALPEPVIERNCFVYKVKLIFKKKKTTTNDAEQFQYLLSMASGACSGNGQWQISDDNGRIITVEESKELKEIKIGDLNLNIGNHFDQIFDRKPHIEIIHSALVAFEESKRRNSFHTLLTSPPGSAKTELLRAIKSMVGADAVTEFDATSSTAAGIRRLMLDSEKYIPPILLIEEIEKTDEFLLRSLLSLLDSRQEIRGLNYRTGLVYKERPVLCFATANNIKVFENALSGSLASRFSNKIYCPRPSWEVMEKILLREISKTNGKKEWIQPTLEYCQNVGETDPRRAITICLCGRDKLLTGKYQKYLDATKMQ